MTTGLSVAEQRERRALGRIVSPVDLLERLGLTDRALVVLNVWGVSLVDVTGRRRYVEVVRARHHLWSLLRTAGQSYSAIARAWGCDHTSILHGVAVHVARFGEAT